MVMLFVVINLCSRQRTHNTINSALQSKIKVFLLLNNSKHYSMDSINQQQPEDNYEDLQGEAARKKIKELANSAKTCFFCTHMSTDHPFATRPMAVQQIDDEGNFWFLSANDSHKNLELLSDSHVQLLFQGSSYSDFLNIYGIATIST